MKDKASPRGVYKVECFDINGILKWKDEFKNLITNEGRQHIIDTVFSAGANVATWYLGLTDGTPTPALADTLASHAGWVEETGYTGNRQEWVEVRTAQTATNSASVAVFPITGSATIGGGMLASVASGTTGVLMSAGALSGGDRSVINGDTVNLTYSYTE